MVLSDLIKKELITLNLKCSDKFEAFNLLYKKLYENNYVKETYINGITEREKNYPTGIDLQKDYNVAIPHTESEYVLKSAICIAILDKPIIFKKMDYPEDDVSVKIIFMIALNEKGKQVEVLEKLVSIFTNEELMGKILKVNTEEELLQIFKLL